MPRFSKVCLIAIAGFTIFLGVSVCYAHAQSTAGLKIQPAVVEDKANPGDTYSFKLRVTNISDEEKTFYLVKQNIKGLDDEGLPVFSEVGEETSYELSSWITVLEDSIKIAANETKEIPFSIEVPVNASPGSHFGGVFLDFRPPKLRETGSGVGYKVGSIVHLRISGEAIEEARLREFSTEKLIYNLPNVNFKSMVENLGNVLIRPHGLLEVTDMLGRQISSVRVNDNAAPIFPLSDRTFDIKWDYDELAFGRYQAILSLVYGSEGRKTISSTLSFWVLPIKPLGILFGSLLVLIIFIFTAVKLHIRKKMREIGVLSNARVSGDNSALYRRQHKTSSRLMIITIALLLFIVVFLAVLFFLFA